MDCIFCRIVSGEIPSYTVFEDEIVKVFLDIHPNVDGHLLIVPKHHYVDINDIDGEVVKHIAFVSKKMNHLLHDKLKTNGLTICQNNGSAQDVKHYHVHLMPRYHHDHVKANYPNPTSALESIHEKLTK